MRFLVLLSAAALALFGCGRSENSGATPGASKAASARATSPLEAPFKLKDGVAIDVDAVVAFLPPELRPTYQSATFDKALGATVLTGVSFGEANAFTVERMELYGVDEASVARVVESETTGSAAPFEQIFTKIRFYKLSAKGEEGASPTTIAAGEIDGLNIRQGAFSDEQEGSGIASVFNAFELGGLYLKDLSIGSVGGEDAFALSAPDLRLVGVGGGKLAALIANRLEFRVASAPEGSSPLASGPFEAFLSPKNQRVSVGSLDWRGLDMAGLLAFSLRGETPPTTARDLVDIGEITAIDVETFFGEKRYSRAPKTTLSADFIWLAPSKITSVATNAEYDLTAYFGANDADAIASLTKRGLNKLKADSEFSYSWEPKTGAVSVASKISAPAAADVDFLFSADGLEIEALAEALEQNGYDAISGLARLKSASVVIRDEVMLDAFFDLAAIQAGGAGEDVRSAAPALIRLAGVQVSSAAPSARSFFETVANFVEQGGGLSITVKPDDPLRLSDIAEMGKAGPEQVVQALGVEVTHTPR